MEIKLVPPIPDNRRIHLDLSLDEAMLTRTGIGTPERAVVRSARKVVEEIRQVQRFPDTSESL